ncbi:MAG TPA: hypothetical protein VH281_10805 [Gaiellaceae bacterium]
MHHPPVRARLLATALYGVAAFVAALPAALHFRSEFISTGFPGYGEAAFGDHLQTSYRFWLVGRQLEHGGAPWIDPFSYQPLVDPQVVLGGWPFGFAFWPLDALFGPVVAWNLLLLAVTVGAGLFTYLWLEELELPPLAAALGGLAFAIAPYRIVQSGGHLLGWVAIFIPLALWAFERSRRADGVAAHGWGALAAAAIVSIPLSGQLHLALGALPFLAAYAAIRYRRLPAIWVWAGVLAGVGVGLAADALTIADSSVAGGRALAEVTRYSASPLDLVSRWRLHGLERFVYLGWLTPVLAVAGLVLLAGRRRGLAILLGLAALLPVLLALGTNLPGYDALRDAFPPLRYPRVPGRFLPLADLALAAGAAVAVAAVLAWLEGRRRVAAAALFFALLAADLLVFPLRPSEADPGNPAYAALDAAEPGRVLELPIFQRGTGQFGSVYQYYTLQAPRERPTGYALAPPEAFEFTDRFNRLDCGAWLPGDRAELARLGIRFVVFHEGLYEQSGTPGAWQAWEGLRREGLGVAAGGPAVYLWRVGATDRPPPANVTEPSPAEPLLCDGWKDGVLALPEAALWLAGAGRAELELQTESPAVVRVFVDGRALPPERIDGRATVVADVGGTGWHAFVVRARPGLRLVSARLAG